MRLEGHTSSMRNDSRTLHDMQAAEVSSESDIALCEARLVADVERPDPAADVSTATPHTDAKHTSSVARREALVQKAREGNVSALLELCELIAQGVLFRVKYILNNHPDAEDTAQEVMIRVCRNIHQLDNPKAFNGWLNSIILNEARRSMKKNSRHDTVIEFSEFFESIEEEDEDYQPQECVLIKEDRRLVMEIVNTLPERQRTAILLHYYDDLSVRETAEVMGIAHSNVSGYLRLAREKIKRELMKYTEKSGQLARSRLAMPIGMLLAETLHLESGQMMQGNTEWTQQVISTCADLLENTLVAATQASPVAASTVSEVAAQTIQTGIAPHVTHAAEATVTTTAAAAATAATSASLSIFNINVFHALIALILTAVAALTLGYSINEASRSAIVSRPLPDTHVTGTVLFSGGDAAYEHLNPTEAILLTNAAYGNIKIHDWRITRPGDTEVLYQGIGNNASNAIQELRASGQNGEYILTFYLEDVVGNTYILYTNVYFWSGETEIDGEIDAG